LAVIALVAFLLTLKPVAEVVKTGAEKLGINFTQIYKTIKSINENRIIETHDGKKYKLELKEIKDE